MSKAEVVQLAKLANSSWLVWFLFSPVKRKGAGADIWRVRNPVFFLWWYWKIAFTVFNPEKWLVWLTWASGVLIHSLFTNKLMVGR